MSQYKTERVQVGSIVVGAGVHRTQHCSYAAWYTNMVLTPGTYPLYGNMVVDGGGERDNAHLHIQKTLFATIPATVTDDYYGAHFGGVAVGSYDTKQNAGKSTKWDFGTWAPCHAGVVTEWEQEGVTVTLDGFEGRPYQFTLPGLRDDMDGSPEGSAKRGRHEGVVIARKDAPITGLYPWTKGRYDEAEFEPLFGEFFGTWAEVKYNISRRYGWWNVAFDRDEPSPETRIICADEEYAHDLIGSRPYSYVNLCIDDYQRKHVASVQLNGPIYPLFEHRYGGTWQGIDKVPEGWTEADRKAMFSMDSGKRILLIDGTAYARTPWGKSEGRRYVRSSVTNPEWMPKGETLMTHDELAEWVGGGLYLKRREQEGAKEVA